MEEVYVDKLLNFDIWICDILNDRGEVRQAWLGAIHHLFGCQNMNDVWVWAIWLTEMTFRSPSRISRSFRLSRSFFSCVKGRGLVDELLFWRTELADAAASRVRSRAGWEVLTEDDS